MSIFLNLLIAAKLQNDELHIPHKNTWETTNTNVF